MKIMLLDIFLAIAMSAAVGGGQLTRCVIEGHESAVAPFDLEPHTNRRS